MKLQWVATLPDGLAGGWGSDMIEYSSRYNLLIGKGAIHHIIPGSMKFETLFSVAAVVWAVMGQAKTTIQ